MILEKGKSGSIIKQLERVSGTNCPWEISKIKLWCEKVVHQVACNPLLSISVSHEQLKEEAKQVVGKAEYRSSSTWVGLPSEFFGLKHRDSDGGLIEHNTATSNFHLMKEVFVFNFYEFGPIVFNSKNQIIERLSTPFFPLVALEQNFPCQHETVGIPTCAISDRFNEANFAHWLLDSIPRIIGAELLLKENKEIAYLCHKTISGWQDEMLSAYSIPSEKRIELEPGKLYKFDEIVLPNDFGGAVYHPANKANLYSLEKIRGRLENKFSNEFDVLMIERTLNRRLINQSVLVDSLLTAGLKVKIVDTSNLAFTEQRALFNQAKIVIGVHGAALASSVFMQKGSLMFELLPKSYGNPAFWIVSSAIGVKYFGVTDLHEVEANVRPRLKDVVLNNSTIKKISTICSEYNREIN